MKWSVSFSFLVALAAFSFGNEGGKIQPFGKERVEEFLTETIKKNGRAVFVSRGGEFAGMDSDSLISFEPNGAVILEEHGFVRNAEAGTYEITEKGTIVATFEDYVADWPFMKIYEAQGDVWLSTSNGNGEFIMGERGGAVTGGDLKPFWPFKLTDRKAKPEVGGTGYEMVLAEFTAPKIPENFKWKEKKITIFLKITVSDEGKASISSPPKVLSKERVSEREVEMMENPIGRDDWRFQLVHKIEEAIKEWKFEFSDFDGDVIPGKLNVAIQFEKLKSGLVHKIVDVGVFRFDNMPQRTEKNRSRQAQWYRELKEE